MSGNPDSFERLFNQIFKPSKQSRRNLNIDIPREDQSTFWGRFLHFSKLTDPRNLFCTRKQLEEAIDIVTRIRSGEELNELSEDEIWRAKYIYDNTFHPDTGQKLNFLGRMSCQIPANTILTSCILTYQKSSLGPMIFWHWANQSFNSLVNYSNRNGTTVENPKTSYFAVISHFTSTVAGMVSVLGLNDLLRNSSIRRYVPILAISYAHVVNVPFSRFRELQKGIVVSKVDGKEVGISKKAAQIAILETTTSRIAIAAPPFLLSPIITRRLVKFKFMRILPFAPLFTQMCVCGVLYSISVPFGLALYPQFYPVHVTALEKDLQDKIKQTMSNPPEIVYFNKGL